MSTSKDRRESRRENNVLKETLIGTVNLISYKNDEYSIGTKDGSDINKLKRKDNILERKHRKKKGKYAIHDKGNPEYIQSSAKLGEKQFKSKGLIVNSNSLDIIAGSHKKKCFDNCSAEARHEEKKDITAKESSIILSEPESKFNADDLPYDGSSEQKLVLSSVIDNTHF